ncbi:MAG: hypothetical protein HRT82_17100 [Henriciella sp.]|nr:hypothetical protein [Henriciella sp.]
MQRGAVDDGTVATVAVVAVRDDEAATEGQKVLAEQFVMAAPTLLVLLLQLDVPFRHAADERAWIAETHHWPSNLLRPI